MYKENLNKMIKELTKKNGENYQIVTAIEEATELQKSICKILRYGLTPECIVNFIEEATDVLITAEWLEEEIFIKKCKYIQTQLVRFTICDVIAEKQAEEINNLDEPVMTTLYKLLVHLTKYTNRITELLAESYQNLEKGSIIYDYWAIYRQMINAVFYLVAIIESDKPQYSFIDMDKVKDVAEYKMRRTRERIGESNKH